jgi:hypothetical protein
MPAAGESQAMETRQAPACAPAPWGTSVHANRRLLRIGAIVLAVLARPGQDVVEGSVTSQT